MHYGIAFTIALFDWRLRYNWVPEGTFTFGECAVQVGPFRIGFVWGDDSD